MVGISSNCIPLSVSLHPFPISFSRCFGEQAYCPKSRPGHNGNYDEHERPRSTLPTTAKRTSLWRGSGAEIASLIVPFPQTSEAEVPETLQRVEKLFRVIVCPPFRGSRQRVCSVSDWFLDILALFWITERSDGYFFNSLARDLAIRTLHISVPFGLSLTFGDRGSSRVMNRLLGALVPRLQQFVGNCGLILRPLRQLFEPS